MSDRETVDERWPEWGSLKSTCRRSHQKIAAKLADERKTSADRPLRLLVAPRTTAEGGREEEREKERKKEQKEDRRGVGRRRAGVLKGNV